MGPKLLVPQDERFDFWGLATEEKVHALLELLPVRTVVRVVLRDLVIGRGITEDQFKNVHLNYKSSIAQT